MTHRYPFSVICPSACYGQSVAIYCNLQYNIFSLKRGGKHGLLLSHAGVCTIISAVFDVELKGRERAIRRGRKNVHAYIVGWMQHLSWDLLTEAEIKSLSDQGYQRVTYNLHPDRPEFYLKDCDFYTPVKTAKSVIVTGKTALALL